MKEKEKQKTMKIWNEICNLHAHIKCVKNSIRKKKGKQEFFLKEFFKWNIYKEVSTMHTCVECVLRSFLFLFFLKFT